MPALGHALGIPFKSRRGRRVPYPSFLIQRNSDSIDPLTTNEFNDLLDELYVTQAQAVESNCANFTGFDYGITDGANAFPNDFVISGWIDTSAPASTQVLFSKYYEPDGNKSVRFHKTSTGFYLWTSSNGTAVVQAEVDINDLPGTVAFLLVEKTGTTVQFYCDGLPITTVGSASETIHQSTEEIVIGSVRLGADSYVAKYQGLLYGFNMCMLDGTCVTRLSCGEGAGLSLADSSVYGNNVELILNDEDTFWGSTQDDYHDHLVNGFSLYEHATLDPIYVSFLTTGIPNPSPTVPAGYTLTKHVEGTATSGGTANGSETLRLGTDAQMLACSLYSPDGLTFTAFSFEEAQAFVSGNDNHWLKWGLDKYGSCMWVEDNQYDFSADLQATVAMYKRFLAFYEQGDCGGGAYEIAYDEDGTAQYNEDGSLELVLPT